MTAIERHALEIELLVRQWEGVANFQDTATKVMEHVEAMKLEAKILREQLDAANLGWA